MNDHDQNDCLESSQEDLIASPPANFSRTAFAFSATGFTIILGAFLLMFSLVWTSVNSPTCTPREGCGHIFESLLLFYVIAIGASILATLFYIVSFGLFVIGSDKKENMPRHAGLAMLLAIPYPFFLSLTFPPILQNVIISIAEMIAR